MFDAGSLSGKTKGADRPCRRVGSAVEPRLTIPGHEQNGTYLSAVDFTGGNLLMEFSPHLQENIKNGSAQIDVGSTCSGCTNSAISQRYAQLDLVRRFDSVLSALRVGGKWREMSIHRETGRDRTSTRLNSSH